MQENNNSIKQWAKDDRPREKLLTHGADTLSNSELMAILINHGTKNKSAIELGKEVLELGKNNLPVTPDRECRLNAATGCKLIKKRKTKPLTSAILSGKMQATSTCVPDGRQGILHVY